MSNLRSILLVLLFVGVRKQRLVAPLVVPLQHLDAVVQLEVASPAELQQQQVTREVCVEHGDLAKVAFHLVEHILLFLGKTAQVASYAAVLFALVGRRR